MKMRERKESKRTPGFFDLTSRWTIVPFTQKENIKSIGLGDGTKSLFHHVKAVITISHSSQHQGGS